MPNCVYRKLLEKKNKAQWFGAYPHISNNFLVEVRLLFSAGIRVRISDIILAATSIGGLDIEYCKTQPMIFVQCLSQTDG